MKAKYIIFTNNGIDLPVIFNPILKHEDVKVQGWQPISAGFCSFGTIGWRCFGKSVSLKLESNKTDEMVLNKLEWSL